MIKELKRNPHGILIGNKKVTVLKTLRKGDLLTVYIKEKDESAENITPVFHPLDIPFEDRDVIVCVKPPFMATHPSQDNYGTTLANALCHHFLHSGGPGTIRPVNRLDKNTSGLILVAKNMYASGVLSDALRDKEIKREYFAIVEGAPEADEGTIDAPIARADGSTIKRCVDFERGERAVTHYKVIKRGEFSLVRVWLETGRTHQIRVHFSYIGHPVAGDFLYGTEFSGGMERHALHSATLEFEHPITGERMYFESPLPEDMRQLCIKQFGDTDETFGI